MNDIKTIIWIFFDPLNLATGIVVVAITLVIIKYIYKDKINEREDGTEAGHYPSFLERFAIAYESCEFQGTARGRLGNYIDMDKLLMASSDFNLLEETSSKIAITLQSYPPTTKTCFVEKDSGPIGMIVLAGLVANKLGKQISTVRPLREVEKMVVEGEPINPDDQVVLVQDVITSGFQIIQATRRLKKITGANVIGAVALVDREESKDQEFLDMNIRWDSVLTLSEIKATKKTVDEEVTPTV